MVVPVSLDPGRHDPRSPYFEGCHQCGSPGKPDPCRECQERQAKAEAEREHWEEKAKEHRQQQEEAEAVAGPEEGQDGT